MARRVILDTGVLIAIERGKLDVDAVLGLDDAAIAAITAMELQVGVERAARHGQSVWRRSCPASRSSPTT